MQVQRGSPWQDLLSEIREHSTPGPRDQGCVEAPQATPPSPGANCTGGRGGPAGPEPVPMSVRGAGSKRGQAVGGARRHAGMPGGKVMWGRRGGAGKARKKRMDF